MNAKFRMVCDGEHSYIELDGKTIGRGVVAVNFSYDPDRMDDPELELRINLQDFRFMPDGYFDEVERKLLEKKPPDDPLNGRLGVTS